jgi:hypothetical protein
MFGHRGILHVAVTADKSMLVSATGSQNQPTPETLAQAHFVG